MSFLQCHQHEDIPNQFNMQLRRGHGLSYRGSWRSLSLTGWTRYFQCLTSCMVKVTHLHQPLLELLQQSDVCSTVEIALPNTTFSFQSKKKKKKKSHRKDVLIDFMTFKTVFSCRGNVVTDGTAETHPNSGPGWRR